RRERAAGKLYAAGAHYVVDTLADLPEVIADINARLAKGERP
ncbi:phosphonoacetaldehyde hydrolase, partial [Klebsiella pneumoniae]